MAQYEILNAPLLARNLAASRSPRLQPSVPAEFSDFISNLVARGDISIDPADGKPITAKGQTLEEALEDWLSTRPHALLPILKEDPADEVWTEANLTKRAARLKHLREFCGSDAAALILLREEAALYGVKNPFSTEVGEKIVPGEKPKGNAVSSQNPWNDEYVKRHGLDAAYVERARLMKVLGLKVCGPMAKSAGKTLTGAKL